MPVNKNALIRYIALDKSFRDKATNYDIEGLLMEKCNEAIKSYDSKSEGIKKRQLYDGYKFHEICSLVCAYSKT